MAHHKSAKKRIVRNNKRAIINSVRRSTARTFIKKVEAAVKDGNKTLATDLLKVAQSELTMAASRGIFHKNFASRNISRLSALIKAL